MPLHSRSIKSISKKLSQRYVALQYRSAHKVKEEHPKTSHLDEVKSVASHWKRNHPLCLPEDTELNEKDLAAVHEISCYPDFVKLLANDEVLREAFFIWTFRNRLGVKEYIEFPALCLLRKNLSYRHPKTTKEHP
jgi:hypothetical protein